MPRVSDALEPEMEVLFIGPPDAAVHLGRDTRNVASDLRNMGQDMASHQRGFTRHRIEAVGSVPEQ